MRRTRRAGLPRSQPHAGPRRRTDRVMVPQDNAAARRSGEDQPIGWYETLWAYTRQDLAIRPPETARPWSTRTCPAYLETEEGQVVKVGVPKEVKNHEYRVAITPSGVLEFARNGHEVLIEQGAGSASLLTDEEFAAAGAPTLPPAADPSDDPDLGLSATEPL